MAPVDGFDLVQDITTDCSVVASLCAGTARASKGHGTVSLDGQPRSCSNSNAPGAIHLNLLPKPQIESWTSSLQKWQIHSQTPFQWLFEKGHY